LPTTGLVGGCGIGLSLLVDAIAIAFPLRNILISTPSLRANGSRERAPDARLREAIP
jgi:hypothetical protein